MHRGIIKVGLIAFVTAVLFGFGATVLVRYRETHNQTRCQWHLQQVGLKAMWTYADPGFVQAHQNDAPNKLVDLMDQNPLNASWVFPPGTLANPQLSPEQRLSWQVILLPQLGRDDVRRQIDVNLGWAAKPNRSAVASLVKEYVCPTQFQKAVAGEPVVTHYIGAAGLGIDAPGLPRNDPRSGFLRYDDPTKGDDIQRGLSRTLTILETASDLGPWAAGGPSTVRGLDAARPYIGIAGQFGGHPAGANAAFADGSVRFQANSISPQVLEMLVTLRPMSSKDE
jgi:prepilin-type processing-associated H-X9-DG protein